MFEHAYIGINAFMVIFVPLTVACGYEHKYYPFNMYARTINNIANEYLRCEEVKPNEKVYSMAT